MKKYFSLIVFLISSILLNAQKTDYNKLSPEYQSIAQQALKKLSPASLQWFIDNSAKHPAGNFDSVWAKRTLSGKFTPDQMNALGDIFMIMMAYQKMLNKEAREDRRLAQEDAKLETQAKNEKLNQDNQTINQQKQEAREKYDRSMQNANTELQIGIISSAGAIDSAQGHSSHSNNTNSNANGTVVADSLKNRLNNKAILHVENTVAGQKLRNQLLKLNL